MPFLFVTKFRPGFQKNAFFGQKPSALNPATSLGDVAPFGSPRGDPALFARGCRFGGARNPWGSGVVPIGAARGFGGLPGVGKLHTGVRRGAARSNGVRHTNSWGSDRSSDREDACCGRQRIPEAERERGACASAPHARQGKYGNEWPPVND